MEETESSTYCSDQQYFLDVCRSGDLQELKQFINELGQSTNFDWSCLTPTHDNFLHMLAANNLSEAFEYLYPIVMKKLSSAGWQNMVNKQNSTSNTPLHYAVITNSKEMVLKLVQNGAKTDLTNDSGRNAFAEAEEFDKLEIAQILAPITKHDVQELRKGVETLDVCNEDSDDEEEESNDRERQEETLQQVGQKGQEKKGL